MTTKRLSHRATNKATEAQTGAVSHQEAFLDGSKSLGECSESSVVGTEGRRKGGDAE